jgi:DNA replication protein DnaC
MQAAVLKDMGAPIAYRSCTFEGFEKSTKDQRRASRAVEGWTKNADTSLFLCGPCGVGKTHLATAALLAMRAQGYSGQYVSDQELLLECRDSFRHHEGLEAVLEKYGGRNVLLLDDLGAENPTPFARETIGLLIDRAYRDAQDLIVTSNYDFETLA